MIVTTPRCLRKFAEVAVVQAGNWLSRSKNVERDAAAPDEVLSIRAYGPDIPRIRVPVDKGLGRRRVVSRAHAIWFLAPFTGLLAVRL